MSSERRTTTVDELQDYLAKHDIPIDMWGKGSAKTIEHLLHEIQSGDAEVVQESTGLVRYVHFVNIEIFAHFDGRQHRLVEDRQVFNEGLSSERIRRREDMGGSVKEKIHPSENPMVAAARAIQEELQVFGKIKMRKTDVQILDKESPSFPGLHSKYKAHFFVAELIGNQINPQGYKEVQPDKTTYFVWQ